MLDTLQIAAVHARIRDGVSVPDVVFDRIYPPSVRWRSASFWTPVHVAMRAAELLATHRSSRVLDVGSGVGKLCIIGAARTGALFVGVEHREHLAIVARNAALRLGTSTARFFHTTFDKVDIETFDAIYFFNPFEENLWPANERFDNTIDLSVDRFVDDCTQARRMLSRARPGTRVVTYHGLGDELPLSYDLVDRERIHSSALELWVKTDNPSEP